MVNEIVNGDAQKLTMDVNELPNGFYFITVNRNKLSTKAKVIINK
jgi:hypothetical protein